MILLPGWFSNEPFGSRPELNSNLHIAARQRTQRPEREPGVPQRTYPKAVETILQAGSRTDTGYNTSLPQRSEAAYPMRASQTMHHSSHTLSRRLARASFSRA